MARRHGPQLSSLIYDKAFEADGVAMMPACTTLAQMVNEIRLRFSEGFRAARIR
jgi:hypothetical protein